MPTERRSVSFLCLVGASVFSYYLYRDLTDADASGGGKLMATVEKSHGRVRRRPASSFLWSPIKGSQPIYLKESVQVGHESMAELRLKTGAVLQVDENSLVVIDELETAAMRFLRGSFILREKNKDIRITKGRDGTSKTETLGVRLLTPKPFAHFFISENNSKEIDLSWQTLAEVKKPWLEIAMDAQFKSKRGMVLPPSSSQKLSLKPGIYFWRVAQENSHLSETRRFDVVKVAPIRLTGPPDRASLSQHQIVLQWEIPIALEEAYRLERIDHRLEVAKNKTFTEFALSEPIAIETGQTIAHLEEGSFFWRIRTEYPDFVMYSSARPFRVISGQNSSVVLTRPEEESILEPGREIRFAWNYQGEETEFLWELRQAGIENSLVSSSKRFIQMESRTSPEPGRYEWRVSAISNGTPNSQSPWQSFTVFANTPLPLTTPKDKEEFPVNQPISFSWETGSTQKNSTYHFELAREHSFTSTLIERKTKEPHVSEISPPLPGKYFWRVQRFDNYGHRFQSSQVGQFALVLPPLLGSPTLKKPMDGATFKAGGKIFPEFQWEQQSAAHTYEVRVRAANKEILRRTTPETTLIVKGLEPRKYWWSVRAIDAWKRMGEASEERLLIVDYSDLLAPPDIVAAEVK